MKNAKNTVQFVNNLNGFKFDLKPKFCYNLIKEDKYPNIFYQLLLRWVAPVSANSYIFLNIYVLDENQVKKSGLNEPLL